MRHALLVLPLLLAALSFSACGSDSSADDGAPPGTVLENPGAPAADPLQGSGSASVAINYPSNLPYGGGPARVALQVQGTGDLSTPSCQSLNGPLTGNYNTMTFAGAGGVATVDLSIANASWQGAGCSATAGTALSVQFSSVSAAILTAEIPAGANTCHDYCLGQPRAPSCEEHCLTFAVIQVNQPLTPAEVADYSSTGQISKSVYLNELH